MTYLEWLASTALAWSLNRDHRSQGQFYLDSLIEANHKLYLSAPIGNMDTFLQYLEENWDATPQSCPPCEKVEVIS